jgi:cytochrome c oxidase subunit III
MSEATPDPDSLFPESYPDATGKGDIHIPGAGTFGMIVLILSLSVLFIASMMAFVVMRVQAGPQWAAGMPRVPGTLWFSTAVILSASFTIQRALAGVRRDDQDQLRRYLQLTLIIGILFLLLQTLNWVEFYTAIRRTVRLEGAYLGMFFVLTGLHAAHVIGGFIPLGIVLHRARQRRYSRNFHPGVRYSAIYWHFLDVIWVVLFVLIYF